MTGGAKPTLLKSMGLGPSLEKVREPWLDIPESQDVGGSYLGGGCLQILKESLVLRVAL